MKQGIVSKVEDVRKVPLSELVARAVEDRPAAPVSSDVAFNSSI